jgi:predicted AAA+ superfamily ATPase
MVIKRDSYLDRLIAAKWTGLIKVIVGIRRCGKSYLLNTLFYQHLLGTGVPSDNIIKLALDDQKNAALCNPDQLAKYLDLKTSDENQQYYVLLDEIQKCEHFEGVLNGLLYKHNVDIYVTGSNSKFLSKDVITEFRGRGYEIKVYPLSFNEILPLYQDKNQALEDYLLYGGLPLVFSFSSSLEKSNYLAHLFKTIYISDIVERYKIENSEALEEIIDFLYSIIGSYSNPQKIYEVLYTTPTKRINYETVTNYLEYLNDAFIFQKVKRYDIKGKKYFKTLFKYYGEDLGLRNARVNLRQNEVNHLMENAIYLELVQRGYLVDVGIIQTQNMINGKNIFKQLEVDFIAREGSKAYYIQSALNVDSDEKKEQEIRPFRKIKDSFKRILITKDDYIHHFYDQEGILHISLLEFLSDRNSLNL